MINSLLEWDREMLVFLNMSGHHSPFMDFFMWTTTQTFIWLPAFLVFFYAVVKDKKREALLIIGITILLFIMCDQISSSIIKPLVARPRPGKDPLVMNLLQYVNDYRGGRFGFLSSHAANSFGFAMFSSLLFRYRWYTLSAFLWAALCSYSRLYLGVHFPLDIIAGMVLGILIGWFCYWLYGKAKLFVPQGNSSLSQKHATFANCTKTDFSVKNIRLLLYSLGIILFCIIFSALQAHRFF
jgi:undecaprenyl-diphosphatase